MGSVVYTVTKFIGRICRLVEWLFNVLSWYHAIILRLAFLALYLDVEWGLKMMILKNLCRSCIHEVNIFLQNLEKNDMNLGNP